MKQPVVAKRPRFQLTTVDRVVVTVNVLLAAAVGVAGFLGADDPNWRGLQRLAVMVMVVLWLGGLGAAVAAGRYIENQWVRATALAVGPAAVLLAFLAVTRL